MAALQDYHKLYIGLGAQAEECSICSKRPMRFETEIFAFTQYYNSIKSQQ